MTRPMTIAKPVNSRCAWLAIAIAAATTGCQSVAPSWPASWLGNKPQVKESAYAAPTRMAVIWSSEVLNQAGKKPTRGFGGRVFFYDAGSRPIPVEGQLVVYAYNDTHHTHTSKAADRKYAFTPDQFATHFTPSDLGASYSIWIPWDEVGGPQVQVSLVPVFTSTRGTLVVGESSPNVLPGHNTEPSAPQIERYSVSPQVTYQGAASQRDLAVQQASFQETPAEPAERTGPKKLSLRLPESMAGRMMAAGPQPTSLGVASPAERSLQAVEGAIEAQRKAAALSAARQAAASQSQAAATNANPSPAATSQPGPQQAHFAPPLLPVRVAPNRLPSHAPPR